MIKRQGSPVHLDSTALEWVTYQPRQRQLDVQFRSGKHYRYGCVDSHTYHDLLHADSAGRYFVGNIRNDHPCMLVED